MHVSLVHQVHQNWSFRKNIRFNWLQISVWWFCGRRCGQWRVRLDLFNNILWFAFIRALQNIFKFFYLGLLYFYPLKVTFYITLIASRLRLQSLRGRGFESHFSQSFSPFETYLHLALNELGTCPAYVNSLASELKRLFLIGQNITWLE